MLTDTKLQTLATALRAETDANVVNYLANRMDVQLAEWCNTAKGRRLFSRSIVITRAFIAISYG